MISNARCTAAALLWLTGISTVVHSHHGNFTFDVDTVITIEGIVTAHEWRNPHSFIEVDAVDAEGRVRQITIDADGASILRPLGVTEASVQPGDRIVATVSPSRRAGSNNVLGREIIKQNGVVVRLSTRYARALDARPAEPARSVIGTWVPERSALFDFVQWRHSWPLTEQGQASLDAYDTTAPFAHSECLAAPAPTLMLYPTAKTLHVGGDSGDTIIVDADWMNAERVIRMNAASPAAAPDVLHGQSVGRWEGDALVVETRGFTANPIGNAFGIASGEDKHLVERFELADDGYSLTYSFELADPKFLREPVSRSYVWHFRPEVSSSGVACDIEAASHYLVD